MCLPPSDDNLYFYYIAEKYKRISDDWNSFEYIFFTLLISLVVFIWCDIINEQYNATSENCNKPSVKRTSGTLCPTLKISTRQRVVTLPNSRCSKITKTPTSINQYTCSRGPVHTLQPRSRSRSPTPPPRRSSRLRRNPVFQLQPIERVDSNVSIHSVELMYCGEWCTRRDAERRREEARRRDRVNSRSRSRSRRRR